MAEPRWLTAGEQAAWRKLAALVTLLPADLDAQLQRDAGLTQFGYWVLSALSETPGHALRMSDLAALSNGSQSRLSHQVAKLEQRGWVRRERAGDDGRGFLAVLTDSGLAKVVAAAPGHAERVRALVFDALTPEQVTQVHEICTAIVVRVRAGGCPGEAAPACPGEAAPACPGEAAPAEPGDAIAPANADGAGGCPDQAATGPDC